MNSILTVHLSVHPRISSGQRCAVHMVSADLLRPQDCSVDQQKSVDYIVEEFLDADKHTLMCETQNISSSHSTNKRNQR